MLTLTVLMGIPSRLGASAEQVRSSGRPLDRPSHSPGWPAPHSWLQQVPRPSPSHRSPHLGRLTSCDTGVGPHLNPAIRLHPQVGQGVRLRGSDPSPATLSCVTDPRGFPTRTQVVIYRCADLTGLSSQQRSGPEPRGPRSGTWQGSGEVWL